MSFNLKSYLGGYLKEDFIIQYAQRHGWTHQKHREQYSWWDYEDLASGKAPNLEEWNTSVSSEPSLTGIVNEALSQRVKKIRGCHLMYGLPMDLASKMVKTYIGYSPAYGGYICQIGPYVNETAGNVIPEAIGRFNFYVMRKRKSTPEAVAESVANKIKEFSKHFKNMTDVVSFEPSDFSYDVKIKTEQEVKEEIGGNSDGDKKVKHRVPPYRHLDTLDPNDPNVQDFFKSPPIEGQNTGLSLNARGYIKILKQYLGTWYSNVVSEQMTAKNKTEEEIVTEMLRDPKTLKIVYARALLLWQQARDAGDPVALSIGKPPDFRDNKLRGLSGQQLTSSPGRPKIKEIKDSKGNVVSTETVMAYRTKLLMSTYKQRQEILSILSEIRNSPTPAGVPGSSVLDEAQAIADKMNQVPSRVERNAKRSAEKNRAMEKLERLNQKQQAGDITEEESKEMVRLSVLVSRRNPVLWTKEDVEIVLGDIRKEKEEYLNNPSEAVAEITEKIEKLDDTSCYDDLLTAFNMAKMFFSAQSVDEGGAKIGGSNSIIFNPPTNFQNYTQEDINPYLKAKQEGKVAPDVATPEDIEKEIGDTSAEKTGLEDKAIEEIDIEVEDEVSPTVSPAPGVNPPEDTQNTPSNIPAPITPSMSMEDKKRKKRQEIEELLGEVGPLARTLNNLIKIAEDLDKSGKYDAAEEVHKVIRKYEEKL